MCCCTKVFLPQVEIVKRFPFSSLAAYEQVTILSIWMSNGVSCPACCPVQEYLGKNYGVQNLECSPRKMGWCSFAKTQQHHSGHRLGPILIVVKVHLSCIEAFYFYCGFSFLLDKPYWSTCILGSIMCFITSMQHMYLMSWIKAGCNIMQFFT